MNKKTWINVILIVVGLVAGLTYFLINNSSNPPIYIAIMIPGEVAGANATKHSITSVQMYLDDINEKGGVNGHPLEVIVKEDGGTVTGTEKALYQLNKENLVMIILGDTYSDPANAIAPRLTGFGIPTITAGATAPQVKVGNPWFFRVVPNNTTQGKSITAYANKMLGYQSALIFADYLPISNCSWLSQCTVGIWNHSLI